MSINENPTDIIQPFPTKVSSFFVFYKKKPLKI